MRHWIFSWKESGKGRALSSVMAQCDLRNDFSTTRICFLVWLMAALRKAATPVWPLFGLPCLSGLCFAFGCFVERWCHGECSSYCNMHMAIVVNYTPHWVSLRLCLVTLHTSSLMHEAEIDLHLSDFPFGSYLAVRRSQRTGTKRKTYRHWMNGSPALDKKTRSGATAAAVLPEKDTERRRGLFLAENVFPFFLLFGIKSPGK